MGDYCQFGECWRRSISLVAVLLLCFSIPSIIVALVHASDCPDKGYIIPFFLLAFGIIGVFNAIMTFLSNSLWTHSKSFRCEGSDDTVWFVQGINIVLTFILFVLVIYGLAFGANVDSAQCIDVVWKFSLAVCILTLISFVGLCGVYTCIGGDCPCPFKGIL